ncbi:Stage III sporulation protein D [compost metagenome]
MLLMVPQRVRIKNRVLACANVIIRKGATVREVADIMGVPKSTVFVDMTQRLPIMNKDLFQQVRKVMEYNKGVRHIRGGDSTRELFAKRVQGDEE